MTFASFFRELNVGQLALQAERATTATVQGLLAKPAFDCADFPLLISDAAGGLLEELGRRSRALTQQRFGKVIRFFAPLYLSNECINNCKYCGFSRDNQIARVTLSLEEIEREGRALVEEGFRNVLIVAGEHPKFISPEYLADSVKVLRRLFPSVALEVGPMKTDEYLPMVEAGAEGLVVYQETYDPGIYEQMHTAGPKRDFDFRLATPERAYAAGFRRLGIGTLFGLGDWRAEAISLAWHTDYLLRHCWRAQITISLPRLRPHAGEFEPLTSLSDRQLAQLICAFRLVFPDVGIVLSTREPARLRDGLFGLGVTHVSAGSHTEPGGYTGAGSQSAHLTQRGRAMPLQAETRLGEGRTAAVGQFEIADERSCAEVAASVSKMGYEAVFKDWDAGLGA